VKILVTGATGFIGSAIANCLTESGHSVIGLSRNPPACVSSSAKSHPITWIKGNLDEDTAIFVKPLKPDACIHAAWIATPGEYLDSPQNDFLVTQSGGFLKSLETVGVGKMIVLGTCAEYDSTLGTPLSESTTPLLPQSHYARAKIRLYRFLKQELEQTTSLCWARIFFPYGRGEDPRRLPSWLIRRFSQGKTAGLKTPENVNDYIHVSDVARAIVLALEKGFRGPLNVGTGLGITVRELAMKIAAQMECPQLLSGLLSKPDIEPVKLVADNRRLHSLGWTPSILLEGGLRELIETIRDHRKTIG